MMEGGLTKVVTLLAPALAPLVCVALRAPYGS
jgi:hypothetical protein